MCFVIVGFGLSLAAVLLRAFLNPTRTIPLSRKYYFLLALSVLGTLLAAFGFLLLSHVEVNEAVDYSHVLTVLSLFAAGITAGYFTFTYQDAADDETFLPTTISICFALLFYLVFGAISFYMGRSKQIHSAEGARILGPVIMWALLLANALYDFWDYREAP